MRRPSNNLRTVSRVSYRPRVSLQPTMVGRRQPQLLRDSGGNAGAAHAGKSVPPKSLAVSTKLNESLDGAAEGAVKGLAADTTQVTGTATRHGDSRQSRPEQAGTQTQAQRQRVHVHCRRFARCGRPAALLQTACRRPCSPLAGAACLPACGRAGAAREAPAMHMSPPGVAPLPMRPSNTPSPDEPKFWNSSLTAGSSATASAMVRYPRAPASHHARPGRR